jgi:uncharacterized protein (TIGR00730 family)
MQNKWVSNPYNMYKTIIPATELASVHSKSKNMKNHKKQIVLVILVTGTLEPLPSYNLSACNRSMLDPSIANDSNTVRFAEERCKDKLRICCYGSSSSKTPDKYLDVARRLGYILAKRGHTCVNGAGTYGCMGAMNDGVKIGNGHVVGVIHEMFLVDSPDWDIARDGGAHDVFSGCLKKQQVTTDGFTAEILVAGGNDLQERKRLLVEKADALIVLPGGPGTWDELWEMACARQLGLTKLPIVCVNVDEFYEPFRIMLERAGNDNLLQLDPKQIVHFESTPVDAIRWIEDSYGVDKLNVKVKRRTSQLRQSSMLHDPTFSRSVSRIGAVLAGFWKNIPALAINIGIGVIGFASGRYLYNERSKMRN